MPSSPQASRGSSVSSSGRSSRCGLERVAPAIGKFVMAAHVIAVPVRRDRGHRLVEQVLHRLGEPADAHAGIDHQVALAAAHVPDVAAHQRHDMRFPQERDFVVDLPALEPASCDRQRHDFLQIGLPLPGRPSSVQIAVDLLDDRRRSMRIWRPHSRFVSGGNLLVASSPILPPRPDSGTGEIEIVDRRVLDQRDVARRVHAGRDRPHHVLPVARVDVVVHHDDPLRVHELAQVRPHAHHHALGVAGIGLLHRDDGDAIGAALGRQPEIDDLGELLLEQRNEHLVQRLAQHRGLVGRPAGEGREIDRVAPHGDRAHREDRELLDRVVVAGVVAVGAFVADSRRARHGPRCTISASAGTLSGTVLQSTSSTCAPRSRPAN